jgi:hypothetical protein
LTQAIAAIEGTSTGDTVIEWTETPGSVSLSGSSGQTSVRFAWTGLSGMSAAIRDGGQIFSRTTLGAGSTLNLAIPYRSYRRSMDIVLFDANGAVVKTLATWAVNRNYLESGYNSSYALPEFPRIEERTVPRGPSIPALRANVAATTDALIDAEALEAALSYTQGWLHGWMDELQGIETRAEALRAETGELEALVEAPITPSLAVASIDGLRVTFVAATPEDTASVRMRLPEDQARFGTVEDYYRSTFGSAAQAALFSATVGTLGGTRATPLTVTFDQRLPTGQYVWELPGGADTVTLWWHQPTKALLVNDGERWRPDAGSASTLAARAVQEAQVVQWQADVEGTLALQREILARGVSIDSPALRNIQGTQLLEKLGALPTNGLLPSEDFATLFFRAYPHLTDSAILRRAEESYGADPRNQLGWYEEKYRDNAREQLHIAERHRDTYWQLLTQVTDLAVTRALRLWQGTDPTEVTREIQTALDQWRNQHGEAIGAMTRIGYPAWPDATAVLAIGQRLLDREAALLLSNQNAAADQRAEDDVLRSQNLRLTADGQWVAISTNIQVVADAERPSRADRQIQAILRNSTDARILAWKEAVGEDAVRAIAGTAPRVAGDTTERTIDANGDVSTVMTVESLSRIRTLAIQALDSARARWATMEIAHFTTLLEAAEGLLGLIPEGSTKPDLARHLRGREWADYVERTTTDPTTLRFGEFSSLLRNVTLRPIFSLPLEAGERRNYSITLDSNETDWRGFILQSEQLVSIALSGLGATLRVLWVGEDGQETVVSGSEGARSFTGRLAAGRYVVEMRDLGAPMPAPEGMTASFPNTPRTLSIIAAATATSRVEGVITREGSPDVFDVRMSVAVFNEGNSQPRTDYHSIDFPTPNPSQPVWVIVHGMDDSERSGSLLSVARELALSGMQVITINWEDAAEAILKTGTDAPWTKDVGEWTASQLIGLGFKPESIHFAGHSHGSYVAFAAARRVMQLTGGSQVNAIVALDPAGNVPAISGFDDSIIDFRAVTRNSVAIEGSWIAGSNRLAATADVSFQIDSADTNTPFTEHGLPVTTFASMLRSERLLSGQLPSALTLAGIMTSAEHQDRTLEDNVYRESYEGIITIDTMNSPDGDYLIGVPRTIQYRLDGMETDTIRSLVEPEATIR